MNLLSDTDLFHNIIFSMFTFSTFGDFSGDFYFEWNSAGNDYLSFFSPLLITFLDQFINYTICSIKNFILLFLDPWKLFMCRLRNQGFISISWHLQKWWLFSYALLSFLFRSLHRVHNPISDDFLVLSLKQKDFPDHLWAILLEENH